MRACIFDTCTEAHAQQETHASLLDEIDAFRNAGGKIVYSESIFSELERKAADQLLDLQASQLGEFHRLDQTVLYSEDSVDIRRFEAVKRLHADLLTRLSGKCADHLREDWHLLAPALYLSVPIVTFEKDLVHNCICRVLEHFDRLREVQWVIWSIGGPTVSEIAAGGPQLDAHTIESICSSVEKEREMAVERENLKKSRREQRKERGRY